MASVSTCGGVGCCCLLGHGAWCMMPGVAGMIAADHPGNHPGVQDKGLLEKVFTPLEKLGLQTAVKVQSMLQRVVSTVHLAAQPCCS